MMTIRIYFFKDIFLVCIFFFFWPGLREKKLGNKLSKERTQTRNSVPKFYSYLCDRRLKNKQASKQTCALAIKMKNILILISISTCKVILLAKL